MIKRAVKYTPGAAGPVTNKYQGLLLGMTNLIHGQKLEDIMLKIARDFSEYLEPDNEMVIQEGFIVKDPSGPRLGVTGPPATGIPVTIHFPSNESLERPMVADCLAKYKEISLLHANPDVFESPTGSDVYAQAFAFLLKCWSSNLCIIVGWRPSLVCM